MFISIVMYNHKAEKEPYKINSGAKSEAKLPAVYRAHHNARILCVMEHPTLKTRQNSSILLDVQCECWTFFFLHLFTIFSNVNFWVNHFADYIGIHRATEKHEWTKALFNVVTL